MPLVNRFIEYLSKYFKSIQFLGAIPILLNTIFVLFLYLFYKATSPVSIYFSSQLLLLNASMLLIGFCEQFVHFYLRELAVGKHPPFFSKSIFVVSLFSVLFVLLFFVFSKEIVDLFFKNYHIDIKNSIEKFFCVGLIQVFFYPLNSILRSVLICHKIVLLSFIVNCIVPVFSILSLFGSFFLGLDSLFTILIFQGFGSVLSFFILFVCAAKLFNKKFNFSDANVWPMLFNSVLMRASGSIYTLGNSFLITSILSLLNPSTFAIYSYIEKIWSAIFAAIVSGLQNIGIPRISDFVLKKNKNGLLEYSKTYYKSTIIPLLLFFVSVAFVFFVLVNMSITSLMKELDPQFVFLLFSVLFISKIINLVVSIPVIIIQSMKKVHPFIVVNVLLFLFGLFYTKYYSSIVGLIILISILELLSICYYFLIIRKYFLKSKL